MTTESILIEHSINAAPAEVWEALTTPELLAKWWVPGDIRPEVGHSFLLEMPGWGNVPCQTLTVDPGASFSYTFADWTLTWTIRTEGVSTTVLLEQSGFDLNNPQHRFAFDNMGPGWRDEILPRLDALLQTTRER
jgi:uncharacterized protein YndB with AHSA1/START domain